MKKLFARVVLRALENYKVAVPSGWKFCNLCAQGTRRDQLPNRHKGWCPVGKAHEVLGQ